MHPKVLESSFPDRSGASAGHALSLPGRRPVYTRRFPATSRSHQAAAPFHNKPSGIRRGAPCGCPTRGEDRRSGSWSSLTRWANSPRGVQRGRSPSLGVWEYPPANPVRVGGDLGVGGRRRSLRYHPSWYRKGSEEGGRVFPQPASTLHPQRGSPLWQPVCRQAGGGWGSAPSYNQRHLTYGQKLNSYGIQIALTRLRAFAIINLTGQKPAHEGGNVAQWQSGRFISARSQVRTLSLPHQPRRPIGRLDSRAVSSVVRALASHARGPRFDPSTAHQGPGAVGADEGIWPATTTRAFGCLTEVRWNVDVPKWRNGRRATFRA